MKLLPVYETNKATVYCVGPGLYEVYERGATAETRKGTYHFKSNPDLALDRAKKRADELSKENQ